MRTRPPTRRTKLEDLVTTLEGEDKDNLVDFLRRLPCWPPKERLGAYSASFHGWLGVKAPEHLKEHMMG